LIFSDPKLQQKNITALFFATTKYLQPRSRMTTKRLQEQIKL